MYRLLVIFMAIYPFMIYRIGHPLSHFKYLMHSHTSVKAFYLSAFMLICWLVFIVRYLRKQESLTLRTGEWMMIAYMLLIGLSTVFSLNPQTSIFGADGRLEGTSALLSYATLFLFGFRYVSKEKQTAVFWVFVGGSALVALYGVLQHFHLDFYQNKDFQDYQGGVYTFFDNPNFFSSYLVVMMVLAMGLYAAEKSRLRLALLWLIIGVQFTALLYTYTRSGWLGILCGGMILTAFVIGKRRRLWLRWGWMCVSLLVILIVVNQETNIVGFKTARMFLDAEHMVSGHVTGHEGSNRMYIWKKSITVIKDRFWTGSGPDLFAAVFPRDEAGNEKYLGDRKAIVDKAHNEVLQTAVTLGVPTAILYFIFILYMIQSIWRSAAEERDEGRRILSFALLALISAYFIQSMFNISTVPVAPFFWLLLGLSYRRYTEPAARRTVYTLRASPVRKSLAAR